MILMKKMRIQLKLNNSDEVKFEVINPCILWGNHYHPGYKSKAFYSNIEPEVQKGNIKIINPDQKDLFGV